LALTLIKLYFLAHNPHSQNEKISVK